MIDSVFKAFLIIAGVIMIAEFILVAIAVVIGTHRIIKGNKKRRSKSIEETLVTEKENK